MGNNPRKICLAPAGGGFDRGITANGYHEADVTLIVALALRDALQGAGVPVVLTRDTNAPAGNATTLVGILQNEVAISNNASAELFVKLACNSPESGVSATVYNEGAAAVLAHSLIQATATASGLPAGSVDQGTTYDLEHTNAEAIILHLCDLRLPNDANAIWAKKQEIGTALAPVLTAWAKTQPQTDAAPVVDLGTASAAALDYAVDFKPQNTAQTEAEATIKKYAALFGLPDWIPLSIAIVESDLNPEAKGDVTNGQPTSFGLFQLHTPDGQGAGYTEQQLLNPDLNCHIGLSHMVQAFEKGNAQKLAGYPLLEYVASWSGHPDETGVMPASYAAALKAAYQQVTGEPADGPLPTPETESGAVQRSIERVVQLGIMTRDAQGDFRNDAPVHRWELAVVVDRLYKAVKG